MVEWIFGMNLGREKVARIGPVRKSENGSINLEEKSFMNPNPIAAYIGRHTPDSRHEIPGHYRAIRDKELKNLKLSEAIAGSAQGHA